MRCWSRSCARGLWVLGAMSRSSTPSKVCAGAAHTRCWRHYQLTVAFLPTCARLCGCTCTAGGGEPGPSSQGGGGPGGAEVCLQVDLKGVIYNAWALPLAGTAMVLNVGPTEAKVGGGHELRGRIGGGGLLGWGWGWHGCGALHDGCLEGRR